MVILFVLSNKLTTAANAILLQSTYPLYLLLLGPLLLKEKLRTVDVAVVAGVLLGTGVLVSGSEQVAATAPDPVRGNLVAIASGLAWALTLAALRWTAKHEKAGDPAAAVALAGNAIAFLVCLPCVNSGPPITTGSAAVILYLGLFQVGLGYYCLTRSIRHVPALQTATLLLIEPVLNPLWAWIIHHERPSAMALAGGAAILVSALAGAWWQNRAPELTSY